MTAPSARRRQPSLPGGVIDGATLRDLRQRTGKSLADVAAAVGIPVTALQAIEQGHRHPDTRLAARIVDAVGFRIRFVASLDPNVQARRLLDVLNLAEALPSRPSPLHSARR